MVIFLSPCKYLFIEAIKDVKECYFTGNDGVMETICSTHAVSEGLMKSIGQLFGASLCNFGPAPNFLNEWVFYYVIGGIDKVLENLPENISTTDKNLEEVYEKVNTFF